MCTLEMETASTASGTRIFRIEFISNFNASGHKIPFTTKKTHVVGTGKGTDFEGQRVSYMDVSGTEKDINEIIALLDDTTIRQYIISVCERDKE